MNSDRAICTAGGEDNESLHPCRGFSLLSADLNHWYGGGTVRGREREREDERVKEGGKKLNESKTELVK